LNQAEKLLKNNSSLCLQCGNDIEDWDIGFFYNTEGKPIALEKKHNIVLMQL
jgi:hypothetical protein